MSKLKLLKLVIVTLGLSLSGAALAHSPLKSSIPAGGATIDTAPDAIMVSFGDAVILTSIEISRDGEAVPVAFERSAKAAAQHSVPVSGLQDGRYTVSWAALSPGDGHSMHGKFSFTVAAH